MGAGGEKEKEIQMLKDKIEKELQPQIDKLKKEKKEKTIKEQELIEKNIQLGNTIKKQNDEINKFQFDVPPEEIQKMMEENAKFKDEIIDLKSTLSQLQIKNDQLANYSAQLLKENNQLKLVCGQYQLMILNQMNNFKQNFNNNNNCNLWKMQINDFINNNNINNMNNNCIIGGNNMNMNNNMNFNKNNKINNMNFNKNNMNNNLLRNNSFNNNNIQGNFDNNFQNKNNNNDVMTILFKFEDGAKYPVMTFNRCKLKDVFDLILIQNENNEILDLTKIKLFYNGRDITKHFINNDNIKELNLPKSSVIDIIRTKNLI